MFLKENFKEIMIKLAIVLPCYNEEDVLENSALRLKGIFEDLVSKKKISPDSFVLFVNDGSHDSTWDIITLLHQKSNLFKGLNLAHNVGHQNAILAGMMTAKDISDAVITIDADLQDDVSVIEKMIDDYEQGNEIVYGVKVSRKADPVLKRFTATAFYKLQSTMGAEIIYNHADFRLMSKRALDYLAQYQERNVYLRGLIPMLGLKSSKVDDIISERKAGQSKYTLSKMLNLAIDGITSFSIKPIMMIVPIGFIFIIISIIIMIHVLYEYIVGNVVPGWASLMISIWFVGGVCLMAMGIIGIYIGKGYIEVKRRPLYLIPDSLL